VASNVVIATGDRVRYRAAMRPLRNPPRAPWPQRYGWVASDIDVLLAQHAAWELPRWRMHVVLVPARPEHPRTRPGQKIRVRQDAGAPPWYLELFYRRDARAKHSIRRYVENALARICAERYIHPTALDREILEVLYDFHDAREWGYPDWDGGLRLKRHPWAERKRRLRAAREGRSCG